MKTQEQALADLGAVVAEAAAVFLPLTPLQAAQRAWRPGGPSVEDLAGLIAADRATPAVAA